LDEGELAKTEAWPELLKTKVATLWEQRRRPDWLVGDARPETHDRG
jgi:hypothetical protein